MKQKVYRANVTLSVEGKTVYTSVYLTANNVYDAVTRVTNEINNLVEVRGVSEEDVILLP